MKITTKSLIDFKEYTPLKPAYGIIILSGFEFDTNLKRQVERKAKKEYDSYSICVFDKLTPETVRNGSWAGRHGILFDEDLAHLLLYPFKERPSGLKELVITDTNGDHRSGAFARAYNRIFSLGENRGELLDRYPRMSKFIYGTLIQTAHDKFGFND